MLETVIAKFITKYLNEYIETLNKSQMEMELWKGHAVFQNLTLLPTALSKHHLPFRVRKGTIAKISLNLPWKKLTSEACVVEVSDIFIIVELDPEILIKSAIQAEQSAFHVKEETVTKEEEKGTWQSLIDTVIDNARVNIKNIHIRIEMPQQFGIYALGLIVSSLTFNTCNENKIPLMQMVPNNIQKLYKILVLNNFSVYFDRPFNLFYIANKFTPKGQSIMKLDIRETCTKVCKGFELPWVVGESGKCYEVKKKNKVIKHQSFSQAIHILKEDLPLKGFIIFPNSVINCG